MTRVRVAVAGAEVEIDADLSAEDALQTAVDTLTALLSHQEKPKPTYAPGEASAADEDDAVATMGINSVVAVLGGGSCRELLIAAAAVIGVVQGRSRFARKEWEDIAADAHQWKASYGNQKARDIKRLIQSGEVIENSKDVFSLAPSVRATLEAQLDQR